LLACFVQLTEKQQQQPKQQQEQQQQQQLLQQQPQKQQQQVLPLMIVASASLTVCVWYITTGWSNTTNTRDPIAKHVFWSAPASLSDIADHAVISI